MGGSRTAPASEDSNASGSASDPSITAVGERALVRASSIDISRGAVLAGRYQIEAIIGKGGSGIVLRAFDRVAQVPVAVKLLKPELASDPRWIERFSRELRLGRQIQHPNVCRIFDIGQADGHWFITMDLASSGTLRDVLGEAAPTRPLEQRLSDVRAVAAGLRAIHAAGIIHRDVKPDNFLRMEDGRLVLSDFGLATNPADAPTVSIMVGTPHYMAPEVVMGDIATPASDVWAAAVVIHEILVGTRPERTSVTRSPETRVPPDAPGAVRALLAACEVALNNEPEDRPADGGALSAVIESRLDGKLVRRGFRWPRSRWGWPAVGVAVASVVGVVSGHLWQAATASTSGSHSERRAPSFRGIAEDWSNKAGVIASFNEHVHCMDWLTPDRTLRLVVGTPRRAVDVDVGTGRATPADLPATTFSIGCPQRSSRGELLFEAFDEAGRKQIMLASSVADVATAKAITPGSDPLWLPSGTDFIYSADDSHAAWFSLPVMEMNIISEEPESGGLLVGKAVSQDGRSVALRYFDQAQRRHVVIHDLPSLSVVKSTVFDIAATDLAFSGAPDRLVFSTVGAQGKIMAALDLRSNEVFKLGGIPGRNLGMPRPGRNDVVVAAERRESDVWRLKNGVRAVRLTSDRESFSPDASPRGDVIVEHRGFDGTFSIRLYPRDAPPRDVSTGPLDVTPSFLPDGRGWLYVDGRRHAIRRCRFSGECEDVLASEDLPFSPVASGSGREIAFLTSVGPQRLKVVDAAGHVRDLGPARSKCAPRWTKEGRLWVLQGSDRTLLWAEIDPVTGERARSQPVEGKIESETDDCDLLSGPPEALRPLEVVAAASESTEIRRLPR